MSKLLPLCVLLLSGLSAFAEPLTTNLTPEIAVATALADNRDVIAARFAIRQAEGRLKQAGGLWPNPEWETRHGSDAAFANEGEYDFSTGFKQRFPITGRLTKAKAVARVDVAMAMAEVRNQERLLAGEVLSLCRGLLVTEAKLKANQEIQSTIQKLVEVSEKRLKVAEVSAADVNLAKLELQKLTLAQAALLNQQEIATTALNQLLGREPKTSLQMSGALEAEFDTNTVADISRQILARRPDRQLAALGIDRAGAEIKLARAEKWEDWTVGFDYSHTVDKFVAPVGTKPDNFLGVGVSIPLPLWNRNQGRISEAQATQQRAEAELKALDLRIAAETQTAENQMRRLLGILRQYREDSIKLAETNVSLLQKGYADGLVSITAVIQAQQQFSDLHLNYLEALAEFERALSDWQTATVSVPLHQIEK
ncbi:MAG: TolC family protein [Verrucomicrobia bacterium]|nr:TolC family protein [Verrucomicrobiota bacterium]